MEAPRGQCTRTGTLPLCISNDTLMGDPGSLYGIVFVGEARKQLESTAE